MLVPLSRTAVTARCLQASRAAVQLAEAEHAAATKALESAEGLMREEACRLRSEWRDCGADVGVAGAAEGPCPPAAITTPPPPRAAGAESDGAGILALGTALGFPPC